MSAVIFFIAAIGAITGAVGVVMLRNPFYSVLALVGHLVSLAALFLLLRAEFVAAAQVVVYAGAVMVLYVFVVAYIGGSDEPLHSPGGALRVLAPLFGLALAIELCIAMLGSA
ncbi:MAG: NADH-quinone oxidoreductase subunit J, partial [Solirubrobacteraceae bacterium]